MPKVSIIVPCYNVEKCVSRCIKSILLQTFRDFELILIDDGSTDKTGGILDYYYERDRRIRIIHKQNGGVSSARNAGLKVARGYYIAFADADDDIKPEWLENFINAISSQDLAVQGILFVKDTDSIRSIGDTNGFDNQSVTSHLMMNYVLGYLFGKLFRKDIIERYSIRFDETLRFREDDVFVLQYIEHITSWVSTSKCGYIYFVPSPDKEYGSMATDCAELVFKSLNIIYNNYPPKKVIENQAWSVKDAIVQKILSREKVSENLLMIYRQISSHNKGIRQLFLNYLILNSSYLGSIPRLILTLINR